MLNCLKYMVTWAGMPKGQEYHCNRLEDAKRIARAHALVYGHAELTYNRPPCKEIYFDRMPGYTVKAVEM